MMRDVTPFGSAMRTTAWVGVALMGMLAPAHALPVASLHVVDGSVIFQAQHKGPSFSTIRLTVRNGADLPLEKMKVRTAFSPTLLALPQDGDWRSRSLYFDPPLAPGALRTVSFTEKNSGLHSRVEIVGVHPSLRIAVNGQIPELGVSPFLWNGTTFAALGDLVRAAGGRAEWSEALQAAALMTDSHALVVQVGSAHAVCDGEVVDLGAGVRLVRGNVVGPVALVLRCLGAEVDYDPDENLLTVTYRREAADASG